MKPSKRIDRVSDQQGNALVLSVLILLALSAGGLLSVQRTAQDLLVAGNLAKSNRAWLTAESGLKLSQELIGREINRFTQQLSQARVMGLGGKTQQVLSQSSYSGTLPRMEPDGDSAEMTLSRQGFAFDVEAHYINENQNFPGFSTEEDICHSIWDVDARAGIPTSSKEEPSETLDLDTTRAIVLQYRARVIVGPIQCKRRNK